MATPDNWEQFQEDMRQWQQQAQDLARTYRGLVDVAASGELGALAFIESLSEAPIGDRSVLQQSLQVQNVAGRETVGNGTRIMREGARGWASASNSLADFNDADFGTANCSHNTSSDTASLPVGLAAWQQLLFLPRSSLRGAALSLRSLGSSPGMSVGIHDGGGAGWVFTRVLTAENTTVDSNGFLKAASPIFRLANAASPALADESNFTAAGAGAANSQALGATATHDGVGVYTVHGSLGFATEGWTVEIPQCINGNRQVFIETEQGDDGTITVRTFKPKPDLETLTFVAGEPTDIPDGRWIDLRLSMPEPEQPDEPEPEQTEPTDAA